jgi:hypothetical protein
LEIYIIKGERGSFLDLPPKKRMIPHRSFSLVAS